MPMVNRLLEATTETLYLEEYANTIAMGMAKAKRVETTKIFSAYINWLTGSEKDIHNPCKISKNTSKLKFPWLIHYSIRL